jgi:hypothetical protein
MLRGYGVGCNLPIDHDEFLRIAGSLKNNGWVGVVSRYEEDANKLASEGGFVLQAGDSLRESFLESIGVAEVFFRDQDLYYLQLVSSRIPKLGGYEDIEDILYVVSSAVRRASAVQESRKILQAGVISHNDSGLTDKLEAFTGDVESAASVAIDGRKVRHFSYDWVPLQTPKGRIESIRERLSKENIEISINPAELSPEKVSAAEILESKSNRSLLLELKRAGFARETDILASRGTKEGSTKTSLEVLKSGSLVKSEYLLQCRKSSTFLVRVGSQDELKTPAVAELPCATCSRKFKDELVSEGNSVSDLGKLMSDSSYWMTVWVTKRLVDVGIQLDSIFWNLEESGEEVDVLVDFMGELWLIELKDREFGAGDAYPFNYRIVRYGANRAFIISTDTVSADAKKVFAELGRARSPGSRVAATEPSRNQPVYIEGLDKVTSHFEQEVVRVSSKVANEYVRLPQLLTGLNLSKIIA